MASRQALVRRLLSTITISVALITLGHGAQPPDVVVSDANSNTAMGTEALRSLTDGGGNTAAGIFALESNTSGSLNSAFGDRALNQNTGSWNTATGASALERNTTGSDNTAAGMAALFSNTTGDDNTATGSNALNENLSGHDNTATGYAALYFNGTGYLNTASGARALVNNTTGSDNTAAGASSLFSNTSGTNNTAVGESALFSNTTGSNNIALGWSAGSNIVHGYRNIDIGNSGLGSDAGTIRIGTAGTQTASYIAGISGAHVTGAAVYVTSTGQLGVLASSERYKTAVSTMGAGSQKLKELRPVTFHLKSDPKGQTQYGLIAEEVAKVYPELVIRDEAGQIQGVRYEELAPMLLNEVQKQAAEIRDLRQQQQQQSNARGAQLRDMQQQLADLHAALAKLQSKDEFVAHR